MSRNEHEIISWAAQVRGMNLSEYVRLSALERAGQSLVMFDEDQLADKDGDE